MLQAQAISVEVGGRLVVDSASFTVMARDKVGIVGRNGAGKTSLFKVLGGAVEPKSGRVMRKGGFGYLPQDPKIDTALDGRSCVTHVLSGRGIDDEMMRIEKLRIAMEETPDERNVSRYLDAEESFRTNGGYSAESEARAMAAGLGIPDARLEQPISTLSGGQRRRVELARILFAGSDVLCLDEPTNHLDVDAKEWLLGFLRQYKGALLVISHDLELLDESITRVLHLDRPTESSVGRDHRVPGHLQPVPALACRGRSPPGQEGVAAGQGDRPAADRRRPVRGQGDQGGDGPQRGEAHRPPRDRAGPRARRTPRRSTSGSRRRRRVARP